MIQEYLWKPFDPHPVGWRTFWNGIWDSHGGNYLKSIDT